MRASRWRPLQQYTGLRASPDARRMSAARACFFALRRSDPRHSRCRLWCCNSTSMRLARRTTTTPHSCLTTTADARMAVQNRLDLCRYPRRCSEARNEPISSRRATIERESAGSAEDCTHKGRAGDSWTGELGLYSAVCAADG